LEFLSSIIDNHVKHRLAPFLYRLYRRYRKRRENYIKNVYRLIALFYLRPDIEITPIEIGKNGRYTILKKEVESRAGRFDTYYEFQDHKTNESFSFEASDPSRIELLKIILDILLESTETDVMVIPDCVGTFQDCLYLWDPFLQSMESDSDFEEALLFVESWNSTSKLAQRCRRRRRRQQPNVVVVDDVVTPTVVSQKQQQKQARSCCFPS
jgi:hypothetical protein